MRTKSVQRQPDIPWFKRLTSWFGQWPLFASITVWVLLALAAFTLLGLIWSPENQPFLDRLLTNWKGRNVKDPLDLIRIALTTIGGIGAVGYLVIKYRERSSAERGAIDQLILRAVEQLGSNSPQVRIAGVYALTDIADTYKGNYKQRVVDILCGYLRTDRTEKDKDGNTTFRTIEIDGASSVVPVTRDQAVESTILHSLISHTQKIPIAALQAREMKINTATKLEPGSIQPVNDDQMWTSCKFDLHAAVFTEDIPWEHGLVFGELNLRDAEFYGEVDFECTIFALEVDLKNAHFHKSASFISAEFRGGARFDHSSFRHAACFESAHFDNETMFNHAQFHKTADFQESRFNDWTWFTNASFRGHAYFQNSEFHSRTVFEGSSFEQSAHFSDVTFDGQLTFNAANFAAQTTFANSDFISSFDFKESNFSISPDFTQAQFNPEVNRIRNNRPFFGKSIQLHPKAPLPKGARWASLDKRKRLG